MTLDQFIEESASAQVVSTSKGDALMIGGRVIQFAEGEEEMIDFLSRTLRRAGRGGVPVTMAASNANACGQTVNSISEGMTNPGIQGMGIAP